MKNDESRKEPEDRLDGLLRSWEVEAELPSDFEKGVWQRIERGSQRRRWWFRCSEFLNEKLSHPVWAGGVATAVVAVAVVAGTIQSELAEARVMDELGSQYLASIDPVTRMNEPLIR